MVGPEIEDVEKFVFVRWRSGIFCSNDEATRLNRIPNEITKKTQ